MFVIPAEAGIQYNKIWTQPPPQQPIQPPIIIPDFQPKPNYLKTVLFSVLIVFTLGLIAYLFFQNQKLQKQVLNPPVSPTVQTPSPTPKTVSLITIPPDETAGWKTYTYKDIIFRYPTNWILVTEKMIVIHPPYLKYNEKFPAITFYSINNLDNLSVKEYDDKMSSEGIDPGLYSSFIGGGKVIAKEKMLNDIKGYYLQDQNCEPLGCDKFSFVYNKKIYVITNVYDHQIIPSQTDNSEKENLRKTFNQILSTFKFIDLNEEVLGIQINTCCSCPTKINNSLIGTDGWVIYERGKNYSNLLPEQCKLVDCAPCPPLE